MEDHFLDDPTDAHGGGHVTWRKYLVVPRLALAGLRPGPPPERAWENYWSDVHSTGPSGEVLWDGAGARELEWWESTARRFLDRSLSVVDVGCGNGRLSRLLADSFPAVLGVDVSAAAVELAAQEAAGRAGVSFRQLDVTDEAATAALAQELGPVNVVMRGVLHILEPQQRRQAAAGIARLLGDDGTLLLVETAFPGDSLEYLEYLGATHGRLPDPVARLIDNHMPKPAYIGPEQLAESFPADAWTTVATGEIGIEPVRLPGEASRHAIPGRWAALRRAGQPPA